MPTPDCPERHSLSEAIAKAVDATYKAQAARDRSTGSKLYIAQLDEALDAARGTEIAAIEELAAHRKAHGCQSFQDPLTSDDESGKHVSAEKRKAPGGGPPLGAPKRSNRYAQMPSSRSQILLVSCNSDSKH